jgi:hypothetical protein
MEQEVKEFLLIAKNMRAAQNDYFRYRDGGSLKVAKKLEKQFDERLSKLSGEPSQQKLQLL